MPRIYDEKAWKRLVATVDALPSYVAHSTYVDNRVGNRDSVPGPLANADHGSGSSAYVAAIASTAGVRFIFSAYEPKNNRWWILRAGAS